MKLINFAFLYLLFVSLSIAGNIIYVDQYVLREGSGRSWADAFNDLQSGLEVANAGDQIWVASGTYVPTSENGLDLGFRFRHFRMKNGVVIYGGFSGTESSVAQRDFIKNETILSGDIYGDDGLGFVNNKENCLHVFFHPEETNLNATAILDGFTITGGNANSGMAEYARGGGMANYGSSPTISNCTFIGNTASMIGGGIYNRFESSPKIVGCIFINNKAGYHGGGVGNDDASSPVVSDCLFKDNTAESWYGGGLYNYSSSPVVTNCTFSGNMAGYYGGGMANIGSSFGGSNPNITNCIIYGNWASVSDNEIRNSSSTPTIAYSNVAGCLIGGKWNSSLGIDGGGNMDENPNFDASLQLKRGSPCIDAADGDTANSTDLLGNLRYDDPDISNIGVGNPDYVDMGAYETIHAITGIEGDIDQDKDVDFSDFSILAVAWMSDDTPSNNWNESCDLDGNGIIETGDLLIMMHNWLAGR